MTAAKSQSKKTPLRPQASAPKRVAETPEPVATAPAAPRSHNFTWVMVGLAAVVVLVGAEVTFMLKGKVSRQATLSRLGTFGLRSDADLPHSFKGTGIQHIDALGRYFLIDPFWRKVLVHNAQDGTFQFALDKARAGREGFSPLDVGADAAGNIYVLDDQEIAVFSAAGAPLSRFAAPNGRGIAVEPTGEIWLSNGASQQLIRYSAEGQVLKTLAGSGSGKGRLQNPGRLALDAKGLLYVLDHGNQRVQVFDAQGGVRAVWKLKFAPQGLTNLALTPEAVFINDFEHGTIWAYTPEGKLRYELKIAYPGAVTVDAQGLLYLPGAEGIDRYSVVPQK